MTDNAERMVLFPRYTAVYGGSPLYSAPFNVRKYAKAIINAWMGAGIDLSETVLALEQSADLGHWHEAGFVGRSGEGEATLSLELLDLEWARMKVDLTPSGAGTPGQTLWAVGSFVLRDGAQP